MNIIKKKVQTYIERWYCDCGGEMVSNGECLTSYPPKYVHVCIWCHKKVRRNTKYPRTIYEEE